MMLSTQAILAKLQRQGAAAALHAWARCNWPARSFTSVRRMSVQVDNQIRISRQDMNTQWQKIMAHAEEGLAQRERIEANHSDAAQLVAALEYEIGRIMDDLSGLVPKAASTKSYRSETTPAAKHNPLAA